MRPQALIPRLRAASDAIAIRPFLDGVAAWLASHLAPRDILSAVLAFVLKLSSSATETRVRRLQKEDAVLHDAVIRLQRWGRPIERRLPLLIASILLAAITVFAVAAYVRARQVLIASAGPRLEQASAVLDVLFAQSMRAYVDRVDEVASDSAVVDFLQGTGRNRDAARRALATLWIADPHSQGRVELRRPDGAVVLDTATGRFPPASKWVRLTIDSGGVQARAARVGPILAAGDSSYYEGLGAVAVPTHTGRTRVVGYVVDLRLLTSQNAGAVRDLIGPRTSMLVGSPSTGAWTDLAHPVADPGIDIATDRPQQVRPRDGTPGIGVATPVPGAPWVLWVDRQVSDVLAPMQPFVTEIAVLAVLVIVGGAVAGSFMSRQFTGPIVRLTASAEALAAQPARTHASGPDTTADEIARLDDAFLRMARRVRDSLTTATDARAHAEATAAQLREHAAALETQTQEARALAAELQQQMEESQSLSEMLEQANEHLRESVAEATAARADAETANAAKGAFLASMSHELRTPLNAIAGYLDLLEVGVEGPISSGQRAYLDRVKRAQRLLLRRIDEVLTFAKVDSGTLSFAVTDIPVGPMLSEISTLMLPLMDQRTLALEYQPGVDGLTVYADREKCEQILLNVLSNAMKFTPPGGRVLLTSLLHADRIHISIADTGIGIPADKLPLIFEPFVQLDRSLTRAHEGIGLGLAISRELARGMNGELTAESTVGHGSIFTLSLPTATAVAPTPLRG